MAALTEVFVEVKPDTKHFGTDLKRKLSRVDAHASGQKVGGTFSKGLRTALKAGAIAAGAGLVGLGAALFGGLKSLTRIEKIGAQTNAVLKSTGGVANVSRKQIDSMAGSLESLTSVEAETITEGQNLLLTFTRIRNETGKGNDIFDQATEIMTDMSVALGQDMKSSAIQLGKALNDPIKGVTALQRVGVSFTAQQKEQIAALVESGDLLGAQKVILGELSTEFGGAAEALGGTTAGKIERFKHAVGTLQEEIASALMPALTGLTEWAVREGIPRLEQFGAWFRQEAVPRLKEFAKFIGDEVIPKIADLARWVGGNIIPVLAEFGGWIARNRDVLVPFVAMLGAAFAAFKALLFIKTVTAAVAVFNAMLLANPIGLVVAALAALAAGLIYAYKHSETFRNIVDGAFDAVAKIGKSMWNDFLKPSFEALKKTIEAVGKAATTLKTTWDTAWRGIKDTVIGGVRFIVDRFLGFVETIIKGAKTAFGWIPGIKDDLRDAAADFKDFRRKVNNELDRVKDEDIKINVKTYGNLEFGGAGGFSGGIGVGVGAGGAGPLSGVMSHASQAMGGALDIKTLGLDASRISELATDFVGQTKAAVQKQITKAFEVGAIGPGGFPLPRGRYSVGRDSRGHGYPAQDFPAATGTPIFAVRSGVVTAALRLARSYGIHAILAHAGGWGSLYAHMSRMSVRAGQFVRAGQQIGAVGSTGNSTGPHLHFEARRNGVRVNPRSLISFDSGGYLPTGVSLVHNGTGQPEPVRPADLPMQLTDATIRKLGDAIGRVVVGGIGSAQHLSARTADLYSRGG